MKESKSIFDGVMCLVCGNKECVKVKKYRHTGKVPTNTTRCEHCKSKEKSHADTGEILKQTVNT